MAGLSDYTAGNVLNYVTGQVAMPALPAVYVGLFTAAPTSDAGTGGTEASGGSYARVQVAGTAATSASTATSSATLHFASVPSWVAVGMTIRDQTTSSAIAAATTVTAVTSTTVTMSANAAGGGVGSGDVICFSAWPAASASSGTEPAVAPAQTANGAQINFATATANWGTVVAFGLFDAATSGDLLAWDYIGGYAWLPATVTSASPGVITAHAHGYSASDNFVVSAKVGGAIPTFSQANLTGTLAAAGVTTDTFTATNGGTAINTSSSGDFMVRKIIAQSIPPNVQAYFAASQLTVVAA